MSRRRAKYASPLLAAIAIFTVGWWKFEHSRSVPPIARADDGQHAPAGTGSSATRRPFPLASAVGQKASGSVPTPEDAANIWRDRATRAHDIAVNMKAERAAEIEAVAPRMRLSPEVVQKLQRWSDRTSDLTASFYAGPIETEAQWRAATDRAMSLGAAASKAEEKLLGGLDNWNRFYKLKGASMTGKLDSVDDNGDWPRRGPPDEKPIGSPEHFGPPPDTSEFDHYFAD